jgi:4-alpha-glucanotransferase
MARIADAEGRMGVRGSGILLHITSLPSPYGVGDLGPQAYRFVDFLASARQKYWQVLPLNPTDPICGNSPYSSISAFAGNILFISPELLAEDGLLSRDDIRGAPQFPDGRCDYEAATGFKWEMIRRAFARFSAGGSRDPELERLCRVHDAWMHEYALFVAIKRSLGGRVWSDWPAELRDREGSCLELAAEEFRDEIRLEKFAQGVLMRQWSRLRGYCRGKGIRLIGDIPIYVNYDSVDVWANPECFKLDAARRPAFVAGVPPDYFSKTGQLWGNPVYDWERMKARGYDWWLRRMSHNLSFFDMTRIDHFRGFVAYWEVPAGEQTAVNGRWVPAPAAEFFTALTRSFPGSPIIAEDLGIITDEVREVMKRFGFPGMRVLLFAFGEDNPKHPYLPQNFVQNCVVYTGTHDNNTARGWFEGEAKPEERVRLFELLGREVEAGEVHRELIRVAMESIAATVLTPVQDVLGLGEEARMNLPARSEGNWAWRLAPGQLGPEAAQFLAGLSEKTGRA